MKFFLEIGRYFYFLSKVFRKPEKGKIYIIQTLKEIDNLGINSLGLVIIISFFIGAAITLQTAYNLTSPLIPKYNISLATRDSLILEFSSTVVGLILAGKIGSNIASQIGSMRITEQIDALEIMGVNSSCYLVLPKVVAMLISMPIMVIISITVGIIGGFLAGVSSGAVNYFDFMEGLFKAFDPFYVTYSLVKSSFFAFTIATVPSFYGYYVKGGALEVGKASTKAVVFSSIVILILNYIITQLMLT
ncbi:MAG: ABC transporter permease [Marinilabiliales bacterium]